MPVSSTRSDLLRKRARPVYARCYTAWSRATCAALHRARVASRRLRELLPMLQLDADKARKLGRRLRKVTTRLGTVRELDVLLLLIDELHVSAPQPAAARSDASASASRRTATTRESACPRSLPIAGMRRAGAEARTRRRQLRIAEASSSRTAARDWRWAVDARVARRASRLSAAIADAGAMYLPERLHAVRIAMKKLRYARRAVDRAGGREDGADLQGAEARPGAARPACTICRC